MHYWELDYNAKEGQFLKGGKTSDRCIFDGERGKGEARSI